MNNNEIDLQDEVRSIASRIMWHLSNSIRNQTSVDVIYGQDLKALQFYVQTMSWLGGIVVDDWSCPEGLREIHDEITQSHFISYFGADNLLRGLWEEFCVIVSDSIGLPINHGITGDLTCSTLNIKHYLDLGLNNGLVVYQKPLLGVGEGKYFIRDESN